MREKGREREDMRGGEGEKEIELLSNLSVFGLLDSSSRMWSVSRRLILPRHCAGVNIRDGAFCNVEEAKNSYWLRHILGHKGNRHYHYQSTKPIATTALGKVLT